MRKFLIFTAFALLKHPSFSVLHGALEKEINAESFDERGDDDSISDADKAETFDKIANNILKRIKSNHSIEFTPSSLNKIDKYMCAAKNLKLEKFQVDKHLFKAIFTFKGVSVPLYGTFFNMVKIPVINKATNSAITEGDISYTFVRNDALNDQIVRNPQNLIGKKISLSYKPLSPIRNADLLNTEVVRKNTKVVISIKLKNLKIETAGKLAEDAKVNQVASVINLKSNRVIECFVKSPTEVTPVGF